MVNGLEYILRLQDQLSPAFTRAAGIADSAATRIQNQMNNTTQSTNRFRYSVNELRERLNHLNNTRLSTNIPDVFRTATREAQRLEAQIERIENRGNKAAGGGLGISGLIKGNLITGAIQQGIGMVTNFAKDTYQTTLKDQGLKTAINSTTGGQGKEAVAQTASIADKYGLNYAASLEGVKTLTGGLKSMNIPLAEQMRIFEGVSTGVAAMKLDGETTKGAFLALGQMASKGTVSAEELRGQLGERIPGAFGIAAKAMGKTEAELGKMLERGEIAAKDFLPKFATEMQKTFGADALAAANGPQAVQERFNTALYSIKTTIGEGILPLLTPLLEGFTWLAQGVLPYITEAFSWINEAVNGVANGTSQWQAYLAPVQSLLGVVWGVIVRIFGHIKAIVQDVIVWMKNSELLKDLAWLIGKIFEGVAWAIGKIGDGIKWVWDTIIKPIIDAIEWAYKKIKSFFGGSSEAKITVDETAKVVAINATTSTGSSSVDDAVKLANATKPAGVTPISANGAGKGTKESSTKLKEAATDRAASTNAGGQRSIVININKQVGAENIHVMSAKEGADNIEQLVREAMRRMMLSLNHQAVA
jgi:tape measure domain-containing protein